MTPTARQYQAALDHAARTVAAHLTVITAVLVAVGIAI